MKTSGGSIGGIEDELGWSRALFLVQKSLPKRREGTPEVSVKMLRILDWTEEGN